MSEDQVKENQPTENPKRNQKNHRVETEIADPQEEPIVETEFRLKKLKKAKKKQGSRSAPEETLLLPRDTLLSAGIHIGTRMKTLDMEPFIYRVRPDGLFVLTLKKQTTEFAQSPNSFHATNNQSCHRSHTLYAHEPVKMFCKFTGATPLIGRFIPGQLSNPQYKNRVDPEVIVVSDPRADAQAVKEAIKLVYQSSHYAALTMNSQALT